MLLVNNPVKMITRASVNMRDPRLVPLDVSIMGFAFPGRSYAK